MKLLNKCLLLMIGFSIASSSCLAMEEMRMAHWEACLNFGDGDADLSGDEAFVSKVLLLKCALGAGVVVAGYSSIKWIFGFDTKAQAKKRFRGHTKKWNQNIEDTDENTQKKLALVGENVNITTKCIKTLRDKLTITGKAIEGMPGWFKTEFGYVCTANMSSRNRRIVRQEGQCEASRELKKLFNKKVGAVEVDVYQVMKMVDAQLKQVTGKVNDVVEDTVALL